MIWARCGFEGFRARFGRNLPKVRPSRVGDAVDRRRGEKTDEAQDESVLRRREEET